MGDIFSVYRIPLDIWIANGVDWLVENGRFFFQGVKWPLAQLLNGLSDLLHLMPPLLFLALLFLFAWWASNWKVALFSVVVFTLIGFMGKGLWDYAMTTLAAVLVSVIVGAVLGIPLGILSARSDRFYATIRPLLDMMQTTPAFVYLVPVVMLFSIGTVAGLIAVVIYSLPPVIRLTNLGIRQVPDDVVEASTAFGATPNQTLFKVQIPLALDTIMQGINQNIMLALAMVVMAALIGAGGLGVPVYEGLNALRIGLAAVGGISIVGIAMVLDRVTEGIGEKAPGKRD